MVESAAVANSAEGHAAARAGQGGRPIRIRVADLRPSDRNPRTISTGRLENLKRSLEADRAFLDARPLLVNSYPGRENVVIAGNMRLRAAQELGWEDVPVLVVSLPPDIEAQWNLKDNNQWGDYDDGTLAEILHGLDASGVDIGLLGFAGDEVERVLALVGISADADDEAFDPTPPADPTARPGDVYLLGEHRLVCGDARDAATWDALFAALGPHTADAMCPPSVPVSSNDPPPNGARDLIPVGESALCVTAAIQRLSRSPWNLKAVLRPISSAC